MTREDKLREKNKTIRQLKAQVRQLRKELKFAQSEMELIRELWEKDVIELAKKERRKRITDKRKDLCPQCGNDTISTNLLGIWKLTRCSACDYFHREKLDDSN
jgi:tRNA(Ile2) C34 agmatinyltransferase TiaS